MAEQDPPVEPLRRLDPSEPDEPQELGRLEALDPDAEEPAPGDKPAGTSAAPRLRDGLALAIALAVLLSLSSIAAIGGLVAISVSGMDEAPVVGLTAPIDSEVAGSPITVVERAAGPSEPRGPAGGDGGAQPRGDGAPAPAASSGPAVAPPAAPPSSDGAGGGGAEESGALDKDKESGKIRAPGRIPGWCDASPGTSCDIVPRASGDLAGFLRPQDPTLEDAGSDEDEDADDGTDPSGSGNGKK